MPRISPKKWKQLICGLLVVAVIGGRWWATREPREPVYQGHPLSWWFTEGIAGRGPNFVRLTGEELASLKPDVVPWLSYKAGETSLWDAGKPSSANDWVAEARWWLRNEVFSEDSSRFLNVRFEAIVALKKLGQDAAPAVPSLLKAVRESEYDSRLVAAEALVGLGDSAWPVVAEAIRHGDPHTRARLLGKLDNRWLYTDRTPFRSVDFAQMVHFLAPLTFDPDREIAKMAGLLLSDCVVRWSESPDCAEGLQKMIAGLPHLKPHERRVVIDLLFVEANFQFRPYAAAIVPGFAQLLPISDELTRTRILRALDTFDPRNDAWFEQLQKLAASSDPEVAEDARGAVVRAARRRGIPSQY